MLVTRVGNLLEIQVGFTDPAGELYDLDATTAVLLVFTREDGTSFTEEADVTTYAADGYLRFQTTTDTLDGPGAWTVGVRLVYADGEIDSGGELAFVVLPKLGTAAA